MSTSEFPASEPIRKHSQSCLLVGAALVCMIVGAAPAMAVDPPVLNEQFADLEPAISMLRNEVGKDRHEIVKANMLLTESEGAIFWPLYGEYRTAVHGLADRKLRLISDFAANQSSMSEDQAEQLTKDALSIDEDRTSLKQDYVKKMSKVLSARTVARFFQIDAKLDAAVEAELAARVPLIH